MKLITSQEEYEKLRSKDFIKLECLLCKKEFLIQKKHIKYAIKINEPINYCSLKCVYESKKTGNQELCAQCGKLVYRTPRDKKKIKADRFFCGHSCSAIYNNTHKTHGYRRSKLEIYLEEKLIKLFPSLEIQFNRKDTINSELDIYIPSLKLAFELNGIFHYEPIYGPEKLKQTQNNDTRKFQACLEKQIELVIIDTSKLSYFKENNAKPFLDIIINIINLKLVPSVAC
jgi:hypothetical protein